MLGYRGLRFWSLLAVILIISEVMTHIVTFPHSKSNSTYRLGPSGRGSRVKNLFFVIPLLPSCQKIKQWLSSMSISKGLSLSGRNPNGGLGRLDRCISSPTRHACLYNVDIRVMNSMMLMENGDDLQNGSQWLEPAQWRLVQRWVWVCETWQGWEVGQGGRHHLRCQGAIGVIGHHLHHVRSECLSRTLWTCRWTSSTTCWASASSPRSSLTCAGT